MVLYRYIPAFVAAFLTGDFGLMASALLGLLFTAALIFMASLGFFELIGFLARWAAETVSWPVLLFQIVIGIVAASFLIWAPGGLVSSGCL